MFTSSKYVKRIVLSCLRFSDDTLGPEELEEAFDPTSDGLQQREKFQIAYERYKEGQRWLSEDGRDVKFLTQAFRKFPHLEAIVVNETSDIGATYLRNELGASILLRSTGPFDDDNDYPLCEITDSDSEYVLPALFEALARAEVPLTSFRVGAFDDTRSMEAPLRSRSAPKADRYYHSYESGEAYMRIFSPTNGKVFRTLQEVEIEELPQVDRVPMFVPALLGRCPNLKTLSLGGQMNSDSDELADFEQIFGGISLQFLENLVLHEFQFSVSEMVAFMARHASNLTGVYFFDCDCKIWYGDTWLSLFVLLREGVSFPRLTDFIVNDVSACDFLTHKVHHNPGTTIDEGEESDESGESDEGEESDGSDDYAT